MRLQPVPVAQVLPVPLDLSLYCATNELPLLMEDRIAFELIRTMKLEVLMCMCPLLVPWLDRSTWSPALQHEYCMLHY